MTETIASTVVTPAARLDRFKLTTTRMRTPSVLQRPIRPGTFPMYTFSSHNACALNKEEIAALQLLGLTVYEAKAYLALVKDGPLKASELAFLSHVPRSKLYATLRSLEQNGLVHVAPSNPETFTAASPSVVLIARAEEISDEAASALRILQNLGEQYRLRVTNGDGLGLPVEANELWHINGRKQIYQNVDKMLRRAANSVSYCATAAGLVRLYKAHAECLENAVKRMVSVRLLAHATKDTRSIARELDAVVNIKKTATPLGVNFICIDERELVVIENSPGDFDVEKGGGRAAWTTNGLLVEAYQSLFDREWENSSPLE